jgi:hypothetical protein
MLEEEGVGLRRVFQNQAVQLRGFGKPDKEPDL